MAKYRLAVAQFYLATGHPGGDAEVRYYYECGEPTTAMVFIGSLKYPVLMVDNRNNDYRACVTHAKELLARAVAKPVNGNHARRRVKHSKPALKLVVNE